MQARPRFAIVTNSLEGRYQSDVLRGILAGLEGAANALVVVTPPAPSDADCTALLRRLVDPGRVDGVILLANAIRLGKNDLERISRLYRSERGERIVSVGMEADGIPSVIARDASGITQAVQHLVNLHGYRRIGFLCGPTGNEEAERRLEGFRRAMTNSRAGNLLQEKFIVPDLDFSFGAGEDGAATLLGTWPDEIDAIVAANDEMARGALHYIQHRAEGQRPGIVGFDDTEYAVTTQPPLTTVHRPLEEEGRAAARLMLALHQHGAVDVTQHRLGTRLQVRDSCGNGCQTEHPPSRGPMKNWLLQLVPDHESARRLVRAFDDALRRSDAAAKFTDTVKQLLERRIASATSSDIGVWRAALLGMRGAVVACVRHRAALDPESTAGLSADRLEVLFGDWTDQVLASGQRLEQRNQDGLRCIRTLLDVLRRRPPRAEAAHALEVALKSFQIWQRSWVCRDANGPAGNPMVQLALGAGKPETFAARRLVPEDALPDVAVLYPFGADGSRGHFAVELTNANQWWTYVELAQAAEYVANEPSPSFAPPRRRSDFPPPAAPSPRDPPSTLAELRDRIKQEFEKLKRRVPFKTASLQLFEDDSRTLLAGNGFEVNNADRNLLRPISSDALVADIAASRTAMFAESTAGLTGWTPYSKSTGDINAWIGAPVVKDEKTIGLLTLDFAERQPEIRDYESAVSRFIEDVQPLFAVARPLVEVQQLKAGAAIVNQILEIIARKPALAEILRTI
ncbi:MAG TPA: substrate-binding domain-containing protein, partial [Polyangiaceae bacterium]